MADRLNQEEPRKRQSGLLDAIFDVVEQAPENAAAPEESLFRAKAIEQIDVPAQVDLLLPLTSRMTWIALVGAALVILAGILYAASTERISAVTSDGRVVNLPGLAMAVSPAPGAVNTLLVENGAHVTEHQVIAQGDAATGHAMDIASPVAGEIWQVLVPSGGAVTLGETVATILPEGGRKTILCSIPESSASEVKPGQDVYLTLANGEQADGKVTKVASESLPASTLGELVGVPTSSSALEVLVVVHSDTALEAGAPIGVKIVLSSKSLLEQLLEFR